jgi:FixJ family two-component response regulator
MNPIIFLIDDDESFLRSMERRLFAYGMNVRSFRSATEFLFAYSPDMEGVILTDLHMPGMSGFDLQDELNRRNASISLVFISGKGDIPTSVRAMKAGADSFLTKMIDTATLLETINKAIQSGSKRRRMVESRKNILEQIQSLSKRELQVVLGLLRGQSNREIADGISLAERTVKYHRTMLSRRYSIKTPVEIARMVWSAGLDETHIEKMINDRQQQNPVDEDLD